MSDPQQPAWVHAQHLPMARPNARTGTSLARFLRRRRLARRRTRACC